MSLTFDVCIITHQYRPMLLNAVLSVLNQTLLPRNIYIIQNNPTLESYKLHSLIKNLNTHLPIHILNVKDKTLGEARNYCFNKSNADYLAILDDDDIWKKDRLLNVSLYLENNSEIDVLATNFFTFDKNGTEFHKNNISKHKEFSLEESLFISNYFSGGSSAILSNKIFKQNYFSNQLASEDWEFWLRLSIKKYKLSLMYDDYTLGIYKSEDTYGQNHKRDLVGTYSVLSKHIKFANNNYVISEALSKHIMRSLHHKEYLLAFKIFFLKPNIKIFIDSFKFIVNNNSKNIQIKMKEKINTTRFQPIIKYLNYLKKDNLKNIRKKYFIK